MYFPPIFFILYVYEWNFKLNHNLHEKIPISANFDVVHFDGVFNCVKICESRFHYTFLGDKLLRQVGKFA